MSDWTIAYDEYDPDFEPLREALCTLGNGYFATRGAAEESSASELHYPGTYLAGGYNRMKSEVSGRIIENEDLVNWPNWLSLSFRLEGGKWMNLDESEILDYSEKLHLQNGILERRVQFRDPDDREFSLVSKRFVHMENQHLAGIQWLLTPVNWSGKIQIRSALDGNVTNSGVERYSDLNGTHLETVQTDANDSSMFLLVETRQSHIQMAQSARTQIFEDENENPVEITPNTYEDAGYVSQTFSMDCHQGESLRVEKIVALYTSRDFAISEAGIESRNAIERAGSFQELCDTHEDAWAHLWRRCDIELGGDHEVQHVLRLHIFHLLQTASFNTIDLDVGVPARGLHGEAYRGHIFWDELFIFPFLNLRIPELSRSIQMYRFRRLSEAKIGAKEAGYEGAMYPWQSGSNGREESQELHLNPKSGEWIPDNTHIQRHINAAIAYNVWQYYQATSDMEFLSFYGAPMILEIARFWSSIATYNDARDRYEIRHVVGPDEYHTSYPDSDELGLNNNAYTNVMAVWVIHRALEILELLDNDREAEIIEDMVIDQDELDHWRELTQQMYIPFIEGEDHIISQFEGYSDLEEFDWEGYREKYDDIQRLDRILDAEDDTPNRYKASKQADVVMLFFLFSSEELHDLFQQMGYDFQPNWIPDNIDYYLQRTSHGSTLSRLVHSWVLARSDRERSWDYFEEALMSDFEDIQGGTTQEGIHLGAMAGTVDLIQRCYSGLEIRDDVLWLNPRLPDELEYLHLRIRYRGHWIALHITHKDIEISFEEGWSNEVNIGIQGQIHRFREGESREFRLQDSAL